MHGDIVIALLAYLPNCVLNCHLYNLSIYISPSDSYKVAYTVPFM